MKSDLVLEAINVSKSYWQGDREICVLRDVDLHLARGETIAIVGVSGSGKSTLLHLLAGLDMPDSGAVSLAGIELLGLSQSALGKVRNNHLGFVYQFHHLLPEFSALENVAMPLMIGGMARASALIQAADMLAKVQLQDRATHHPSALSGGERQRVAIARALVGTPDLVLADEPTGNLDEASAAQVHDLMISLAKEMNVAFVVVTHNNELALRMDRMCRLHGGQLEVLV